MSKGYSDPKLAKLQNTLRSEPGEIEFTNSKGIKIKLAALSPYLVQMATESVDRPEPPTYEFETADGRKETYKYDEKSILDPKATEEDKKKWELYLQKQKQADMNSAEILLNVILIEGVKLQIDDEDGWLKRQKLMGIKVPEDKEERLLMYKKQYVIGNTQDIEKITKLVMELTGVSREEIDQVKNSFQSDVESDGKLDRNSTEGSSGE